MDNVALEKLNAYLLSKGKPPKKLNQNFLKTNVDNLKRKSVIRNKKQIMKRTDAVMLRNSLHKKSSLSVTSKFCKTKQPKEQATVAISVKKTPIKNLIFRPKSAISAGKKLQSGKENIVQVQLAEVAKKKLLRRSMNSTSQSCRISKLSKITQSLSLSTPKRSRCRNQTVNTEKIIRKKVCLPERKAKTPKMKKAATSQEKQQRLEQLHSWMISKGKDPSNLCGFKPSKTVLTPVNSPARPALASSNQSSQWPTLREEDFHDELSLLVNQMMHEARLCLDRNRSAVDVHSELMLFKENVSVAVKHASFWITLFHVYQKLGKSKNEIIELFETAIESEAQPECDIKTALKDFVQSTLTEPPAQLQSESAIKKTSFPQKESRSITVFKSPSSRIVDFKTVPVSPLVSCESPSSMIRLRMVQRSSPIFKKMVSRKALPVDINAIVTPVRRSKRLENLKWSLPKGLVCRETCVSSPSDVVKALQDSQAASSDFVFEPNKALGDDFADIQKVLKFE